MSMDIMLKSDEQPFVSQPVNFKNFLLFAKQSEENHRAIGDGSTAKENFKKITNMSEKDTDNLMISLDVFDLRNQMFNREMDYGLERNQMPSQGILIEENFRRRNAQYRSIAHRALRYDHINQNALARLSPHLKNSQKLCGRGEGGGEALKKSDDVDVEIVDLMEESQKNETTMADTMGRQLQLQPQLSYKDLIISCSIYFGYSRELEYHEVRLGRLMKVTDRLELTGEHTLMDLKNAFSCPLDYTFMEDFSEKIPTVDDFAKNKYKSAMFFIHDTFYIEQPPQKQNGYIDPSSHIRKWAVGKNYIGPMNVANMAEKKLGDLCCRLGQPYVFIHQGVCEHLIVFTDLFLRDESHTGVQFPRKLVERNFKRIACDICKDASARWMLIDHENLLPNSPGYLCSTCYKEYCFDSDGKKIAHFKAVPYCDRKEVGDGGIFISELGFEAKDEE